MAALNLKKQIGITAGVLAGAAAALVALNTDSLAARGGQQRSSVSAARSTPIAGTPVLVELFTSEGCSSCPPADDLLRELQSRQPVAGARIIALSEHVDYWNSLGWKDPYSSADYSARQSEYARAFKNDQVYTPQIVVDGRAEFVGSDRSAARAAIARAAKQEKVTVRLASRGDSFAVSVPKLPKGAGPSDVYAAVTEGNLTSSVSRGENFGRRLTHTAVARQLVRIGAVDPGKPFEGTFRPGGARSRAVRNVVAFVQERGTRHILGVAETPIGG